MKIRDILSTFLYWLILSAVVVGGAHTQAMIESHRKLPAAKQSGYLPVDQGTLGNTPSSNKCRTILPHSEGRRLPRT